MIETLLRLSQGHLCVLTRLNWLKSGTIVTFDLDGGGWLLPVTDASAPDIPDDLAECFTLARANSCDWLLFDNDTPLLSILPVFAGDGPECE